ncbi:hypothetical protein [Nostoc sp. 'Lobaria pulmonaria (5183) cyanobiont']|uniref:hypothetical protein n=1 Tax=Nostoc sp. 'Lobaria pulmonaria (5183) cyanobiont' TaxID=1618022 RepID=UPI001319C034|nr:hypothetical protein [Nostoc sp. 'Lobaria pulmonaria (5183) cyanobiont']
MARSHAYQYFYVSDRIPFYNVTTRACQMTRCLRRATPTHQIKPPYMSDRILSENG